VPTGAVEERFNGNEVQKVLFFGPLEQPVECSGRALIARSKSVRGTEVTGIPSRSLLSSGARIEEKCTRNCRLARRRIGAVTSIVSGA
jgi:hypothetical protein